MFEARSPVSPVAHSSFWLSGLPADVGVQPFHYWGVDERSNGPCHTRLGPTTDPNRIILTALLISLVTVFAWGAGLDTLLHAGESIAVMQPLTAIMVAGLATASVLLGTRAQSLIPFLAGGVGLLAILSLGRLLWASGSPSLYTSFSIVLLSFTLFSVSCLRRWVSLNWMIRSAGAGMAVVLVALLGHATQFPLPLVYDRNIAVRTGLALVLLSLALFGWLRHVDGRPGSVLRAAWVSSLTAPMVFVAVILLWVTVVAAVPSPVPVAISGAVLILALALSLATFVAARQWSRMIDLTAAIRDSEERLTLFIEHAPAAIAMFDRDMRYLAVSARWKRDYQLEGDLFGLCHYDVFPELPERWKHIHRRGLAGEMVNAEQDAFIRPDGRTQWVRWEVWPWRNDEGLVGGIVIFAEETTERVQVQQALKDQLSLVKTITDNTLSCLLMVDPSGRATFANQAAESMTGYRPDELIGEVLHRVLHHTHPDGTPFPIEDCPIDRALLLQESVQGYEDAFVHKDGHFIPVRCSARPIVKDGLSVGTVIEVQDISKERQAANELRLLASDLERRVRERTADLVRSQDRLRTLASQLAMAEQRARHRLATELHDYLAQLLALGRIKLGHARHLLKTIGTGAEPLRELQDILDRGLGYTRTAMAGVEPAGPARSGVGSGA